MLERCADTDIISSVLAEISCLSICNDGKFLCVGSEDNTYNIYGISLRLDKDDNIDIEWVLLCKQIVINDANINHVSWINNSTMIASCDKGQQLYLSGIYDIRSGIYDIRDCQIIIDLIRNILIDSLKEFEDDDDDDDDSCKGCICWKE